MFDRLRTSLAVALALLGSASSPVAAQSSATGLSPAQLQQLHELGFAVAPRPRSTRLSRCGRAGRHASAQLLDRLQTGERRRRDQFRRRSGRGRAKEEGRVPLAGRLDVQRRQEHAEHAESSLRSNSNEQVTPEQEQEMTDVTSDSALTGPIHFANNGACLSGSPDASKALITNAHYHRFGLQPDAANPLIRAYKSSFSCSCDAARLRSGSDAASGRGESRRSGRSAFARGRAR